MSNSSHVDAKHPRAESIRLREQITRGLESNVVASAGLIAHGRGEAFDYLLGEKTTSIARKSIEAAAAALITATHPVLSVNGNVAALCPRELIELSQASGAKLEVNLFHRTLVREKAIERVLLEAGASEVLGVGRAASASIPEVYSDRRRVDPRGLKSADTVFVPLEDGDRTEALVKMGKTVITIDLNPLSRTSKAASITIVDNVVRALPILIDEVKRLKGTSHRKLEKILSEYNNSEVLSQTLQMIEERLHSLAMGGVVFEF